MFRLENMHLKVILMFFFTKPGTFKKCEANIEITLLLHDKLGFMINLKINKIIPNQK